jgi:ribose/xylose/arabinose/galactoside ABC-type transport system permease subunit
MKKDNAKMLRTHKVQAKLVMLGLKNTPLVLFVLIFIIFGIVSPNFFQYQSLENAIKQASYIGIVAVGMTFVLLTAGIDLSVGSNMYLSAAAAGLMINHFSISPWMALVVCLLVGLGFGAVNALIVTRFGVIPFVATLSTMVAGRGLGLMLTKSRAVNFPGSITGIGAMEIFGFVPCPVFIFAIVVLCVWIFLNRSTLGRQIYAVGHDREAARKAGINTKRVLAAAYIFCGLFAALGGFISVAQLGNVNAGFGQGDEFDAIAAAVLGGVSLFGGVGSVFPGIVLGAVLIQMVSAGLVAARIDLYLHPIVAAAIIFIAVLIDSFRNVQLKKLERRNIRIEEPL